MIDQDNMRALAKTLRAWKWVNNPIPNQAADAIDLLLAEVEGLRAARIAYANEFEPDAEGLPNVGSIHENIRKLKDELEAAAADKLDADRYRLVRRGQRWSVINWVGETLRAEQLDAAIDAALAQRQGEGS
ncbi:hypothetical protein [Burkholderia sp. GbtcB21]|uniref:hypothetical protein n=1 Tax=Burkholderia sp. GbtcB21 TaxID=2824766 RepID=UPI0020C65B10|nr:hypothetical protein [Burkholderia sp. GbtcB21]